MSFLGIHRNYYQEAKSRPKGFYYLRFTHVYANLTEEEINARLVLAKELIAEDEKCAEYLIALQPKDDKYSDYSRTEVYYVKYMGDVLGKLSIKLLDMGDSYKMWISFSDHLVSPKSAYMLAQEARGKHIQRYDAPSGRSGKRINDRKWRRNKKRSRRGDIKSNE